MAFAQILTVSILFLIISIILFIRFIRRKKVIRYNDIYVILSKKVMRNNNVFSDNFGEESRFHSLLRRYGFTIIGVLAGLTLIGIAIYIGWHFDFIKNILLV